TKELMVNGIDIEKICKYHKILLFKIAWNSYETDKKFGFKMMYLYLQNKNYTFIYDLLLLTRKDINFVKFIFEFIDIHKNDLKEYDKYPNIMYSLIIDIYKDYEKV